MELHEALQQLDTLQKKMYAFSAARATMALDAATVAPRDTAEGRSIALGILAGERHKLTSSPAVGELLDWLTEHDEDLTPLVRRQVTVLRRSYDQLGRIPADEYTEYAMLQSRAGGIWRKAKETNDFELFRPTLEKLVAFNRKFAGYYDSTKAPYDALLNEYERGMTTEFLDRFFAEIREKLVPLIHAIGEKEQIDDSFLRLHYPLEDRKKLSDYLMEVIGLDRSHCTIGETEHPFTQHFNNKDVRITTNYHGHDFAGALFSVIHESGHAVYELGICDEVQYTCLSGGVSMGVHESQSRFYENMIGRSLPFIRFLFPKLQEFFPDQLGNVTAEQFYAAVNKSAPSLIRIDADEPTYPSCTPAA